MKDMRILKLRFFSILADKHTSLSANLKILFVLEKIFLAGFLC